MNIDTTSLTPMLKQFYELKAQAGDAILFFRMGDFYEIFGTDAELVAPILEIVLTSREKGDQSKIPFCGVPHHSAKVYWLKLIKMGFKVAIADQVEDPKATKGLVRREITRYLTPACIDEIEALERDVPNYLCAVLEDPISKSWQLCMADVSTGELRLGSAKDYASCKGLILNFQPREILIRKFHLDDGKLADLRASNEHLLHSPMPEAILRDTAEQQRLLTTHLGKDVLKQEQIKKNPQGQMVIAALFTHLKNLKQPLDQFRRLRSLYDDECMLLDEIAMRDLEIFETVRRRQSEGSLWREICRTLTGMGGRLLRSYLTQPSLSITEIKRRQQLVKEIYDRPQLLKEIRNYLHQVGDLDRLMTRVIAGHAHPYELHKVNLSLSAALSLQDLLNKNLDKTSPFHEIAQTFKKGSELQKKLSAALLDEVGTLGEGTQVFRNGFHVELDRLAELSQQSTHTIEKYEAELRKATGISSLKIKNHKTFGLLIEVTKANLGKVPASFQRRQTMVNNERFSTPELTNLSESFATAKDRLCQLESALYTDLLRSIATERDLIQEIARAISVLDVTQSFAYKALESEYVCPVTTTQNYVKLVSSRHPVVEKFVGKNLFTANDIELNAKRKFALITGPNMGGKSTIMRQIAITAILHQIGSYVPAQSAELPIFDAIFTRVGAADDLAKGQSTFLVEMSETARILRNATKQSLVILDEVGRGTSTTDGRAIAASVLEELTNHVECFGMFATHYHELVGFAQKRCSNVTLYQTEIFHQGDEVRFTHRLIPGYSTCSYGLAVAKLGGLPARVTEAATTYLDELTFTDVVDKFAAKKPKITAEKSPKSSGGIPVLDFSDNNLQQVSERLRNLRIHRTTPLQALNILNDLKVMLDAPPVQSLFD